MFAKNEAASKACKLLLEVYINGNTECAYKKEITYVPNNDFAFVFLTIPFTAILLTNSNGQEERINSIKFKVRIDCEYNNCE
ncbi:MAG: hypothetical protein SOU19_01680, partial [Candidatus Caccosoma sp.]|nr:hypothetical protein [Candidatus Caccosoma sp.]